MTDLNTLIETAKAQARKALEETATELEKARRIVGDLDDRFRATVREAAKVLSKDEIANITDVSTRQVSVWLAVEKQTEAAQEAGEVVAGPEPDPLEATVPKPRKQAKLKDPEDIEAALDDDMVGTGEDVVGAPV